jgi:U3 small nucleolar RNA-associated protein 25
MKRSFEEHFDTALTETIDGESVENIDTKTTESNKKPRISAQFDKILKRSVLTNCNQFEICNFQELNVQKPLIDLFLKTSHTPLQEALFNHLNSYKDVAYTNLSQDCTEITRLVALHSLNHVLKSRDLVVKNTNKLKLPENANSSFCDQGFTRPRVLILVPFRHHAFEIVKTMVDISGFKKLDNYDRFIDEFTSEAQDNPNRPPDFLKTFAGNIDDNFKVGIQFAGKRMRLYSGFYSSDLIIASPLGLKVTMHDKSGSAKDSDYLSSIEVVIMHHSQIFQMQNWDHLRSVFSRLNLIPKESHDCDFSRVRPYILDGQLKNVRQNVYFSTMQTPELNALESSFFTNYSGKIKLTQEIHGQLEQITLKLPLVKSANLDFSKNP